ncbi:hypothetical protein LguiA_003194 [Lonicera macranthoides]
MCVYIYILLQITDEESDAFTELIAHTVIYVSLYRYQEGMSTARSRMGEKVYRKRYYVIFVHCTSLILSI